MRKFVAIVLVVFMLCLFSVSGFAIDKSNFNLLPASEISFLSDILPRFNQGDGNYVIPVDVPSTVRSSNSFSTFWNNLHNPDLYYRFICFALGYSNDIPYFTVNVFPKSNYKYTGFGSAHDTSSSARCYHYGFWYSSYTTNKIFYMLIGLTQLNTRCSNSSKSSGKKLMGKPTTVIAEAKFIQISLEIGSSAMIGAEKKSFQVADGNMNPPQIVIRGTKSFCLKGIPFQGPIGRKSITFYCGA